MSAATNAPNPDIKNKDLLAVRGWVTARDATQFDAVHQSTVILDLTHSNLIQRHIEIRFDKHDTLAHLRNKIHQKTGTAPHFQQLQIKSANVIMNEIPPETSDHYKLGYFGLEYHGLEVHCVDLNPHSGSGGGQYEDVSLVQKYKMSEQEYDERKGTLRDWGREQKSKDSTFTLAKHAMQHRELVEAQRAHRLNHPMPEGFFVDNNGTVVRDDDHDNTPTTNSKQSDEVDDLHEEDSVANMEVGMRCQIEPGSRRGLVSFVGLVPELGTGHWVGVTFDEPVGKTDGTVKGGKRYFEAPDRRGGFVRGKNVQVGDFPERDIFEDDSDEDEL
jgi:tubulin-folding cofactor B